MVDNNNVYSPSPESVLDVHGGITFAESHKGGDLGKDGWWFGFDCAHCNDIIPDMTSFHGDAYRNIGYVTAETENLAEQLFGWENRDDYKI